MIENREICEPSLESETILEELSTTNEEMNTVAASQLMLWKCKAKELDQVDNLFRWGFGWYAITQAVNHMVNAIEQAYTFESVNKITSEKIFTDIIAIEGLESLNCLLLIIYSLRC